MVIIFCASFRDPGVRSHTGNGVVVFVFVFVVDVDDDEEEEEEEEEEDDDDIAELIIILDCDLSFQGREEYWLA